MDARKILISLVTGSAVSICTAGGASEPPRGCFRTVVEAIARSGSPAPENLAPSSLGFRIESLRHDPLMKRNWATVRSCEHPERPSMTVDAGSDALPFARPVTMPGAVRDRRAPEFSAVEASPDLAAKPGGMTVAAFAEEPKRYVPPVMLAGTQVRLVRNEPNLRFETAAVAQMSGAVGDRIRVRLVRPTEEVGGAEQFVTATVRSAEVLELEQ